ncbi:hypothetical protein NAEGRDRAFT_81229 [Naegleria gruberi]|uniref:Intraflagellar transport protein 46 homolog n=1 Tax=Naegleria gruberi TaxID=5762 RepID=D2VU32_NAEGR|nr:uncharacterized protein NAEGRDRAFT_81229 [Naegleria gruberi]EFC39557.1 hypothetical protein NAEGRDRAFT_81229 [Naegleria gruberi]|eukprot:XP_002672301.1 hypothetical protein NAEGRDRAFT_81229 [Naegleria gruberi strain NEG-M]
MNTSMDDGSDGESTEYETDEEEQEEEETIDQRMPQRGQSQRREDDDFGLHSEEESEEGSADEEENLNSTGKFTSIGNNNNNAPKGAVLSNRYENRGGSGAGVRGNSASKPPSKPSSSQGKVVSNQHYDEVYIANDDEVHSIPSPEHTPRDRNRRKEEGEGEGEEESEEEHSEASEDDYAMRPGARPVQHPAYNANESNMLLSKMNISNELKELFTYINRYKPHEIELDTKLKPFIPDYMAAVGELDPFIKLKRPDLKEDELDDLGLKVIDEPNPSQSDPTVVTLDLTYQMKGDRTSSTAAESSNLSSGIVAAKKPETIIKSVESGNDKLILKWINDIRELHKKKPPPTVTYSKVNVDFTQLIQAWPDAFEEELAKTDLPGADLDVDLEEYVKIICSLLDIPVYDGHLIESLHVLFTLYLDFKTNQHIQSQMNF